MDELGFYTCMYLIHNKVNSTVVGNSSETMVQIKILQGIQVFE